MSTWTQSNIDTLKAAIARGVTSVSYGGRTVTYASLADMRSLLAEMIADVAAQAGTASYRLMQHSKGVD